MLALEKLADVEAIAQGGYPQVTLLLLIPTYSCTSFSYDVYI